MSLDWLTVAWEAIQLAVPEENRDFAFWCDLENACHEQADAVMEGGLEG